MPGTPLPEGEVLWATPQPSEDLVGLLDKAELASLSALQRRKDRDSYASAHALLRVLAARWSGFAPEMLSLWARCVVCGRTDHGKPLLVRTNAAGTHTSVALHVSISHTDRLVVVVVSPRGPVGVDAEHNSATSFTGFDDVALSSAERVWVRGLAPAEQARARATLWVRKEAVLKAVGIGLAVAPDQVEVSDEDGSAPRLVWSGSEGPTRVHLTDIEVAPGMSAAVAALGDRAFDFRRGDGAAVLRASGRMPRQGTSTSYVGGPFSAPDG